MTVVFPFGMYQCKVPTQGVALASKFFQNHSKIWNKENPDLYSNGILHTKGQDFLGTPLHSRINPQRIAQGMHVSQWTKKQFCSAGSQILDSCYHARDIGQWTITSNPSSRLHHQRRLSKYTNSWARSISLRIMCQTTQESLSQSLV